MVSWCSGVAALCPGIWTLGGEYPYAYPSRMPPQETHC